MPERTDGIEVYTIGHSNVPCDQIVALLRQHGIRVLVDVRSVPYAQYATQFNRELLAVTLDAAGLTYTWAGEYLGGRPRDRTCYTQDQPATSKHGLRVDYVEVARRPWYQKGIGRLVEIAQGRRTAIMCSEEDPAACHRHNLIAQTLLEMGVRVWHIRKDGSLEAARSRAQEELERSQQPRQLELF